MPLPAGLTYVTVVGSIADVGSSELRTAVFRTPIWLEGSPYVRPFALAATIAEDGSFSIDLPATDDPAWAPVGWTYEVILQAGTRTLNGNLEVPAATIGSIELSAAMNTDTPSDLGQVGYLPVTARGVAGGVAALDADGDVTDAAGTKITGGEGGAVSWTSITGRPSTFPPTVPIAASDVTGLAAFEAATSATLADHEDRIEALEDAPGGGGVTAGFASGYRASGNLAGTNSTGAWELVSGFTMAIPAVAGDRIVLSVSGLVDHNSSRTDLYDLAVVVSAAAVRYASSNTSTPGADGLPEQSNSSVQYGPGAFTFALTAVSGDISGGNVTFQVAHKGPGTGSLQANAAYPLRWNIVNHKQ